MKRNLSKRSPGGSRVTRRYHLRPVWLAVGLVLGAGACYLLFQEVLDGEPAGLDASDAALASAAESDHAGIETASSHGPEVDGPDNANSRTRSPDSAGLRRDSRSEINPISGVEPSVSDGKDRAIAEAETAENAPGDEDGDVEDAPELSISGAVLDEQGSLLPGITVEARSVGSPARSSSQPGSADAAFSQVTDNLGGFVFEPLAGGEYQLSVEDTKQFHGTSLRVRAGVANAELRVQGIREVRVFGHIIDENGGALEDVRVRELGGSRAPPSDINGAYEITVEPVKAGQAPVLEFQHRGYRSQRRRVEAIFDSDADAVRLDVEMEPTGEQVVVLGQVSGPRGEAVPDAEVWLSSAEPRKYLSTRSNEGGEFEFERVELGDGYSLGVDPGPNYRKYVSDPFTVGPGNTAHDVRLEAAGDGSLSGRLVDPDGRALRRFTVWLRGQDSGGGHPPIPITSDAAGNFEVERVPAGMLRLESASQPRLQAGSIELRPGEARHVEVPLDWGERWMFGKVIDANGNAIAGAEVTLQWSQQHYDLVSRSHRRAATDLEGFFTFSNLGARAYQVTIQAANFQTLRRSYAAGGEELVIALHAETGGDR